MAIAPEFLISLRVLVVSLPPFYGHSLGGLHATVVPHIFHVTDLFCTVICLICPCILFYIFSVVHSRDYEFIHTDGEPLLRHLDDWNEPSILFPDPRSWPCPGDGWRHFYSYRALLTQVMNTEGGSLIVRVILRSIKMFKIRMTRGRGYQNVIERVHRVSPTLVTPACWCNMSVFWDVPLPELHQDIPKAVAITTAW